MARHTTGVRSWLRTSLLLSVGAAFALSACAQGAQHSVDPLERLEHTISQGSLPSGEQLQHALETALADSGIPAASVMVTAADGTEVAAMIGEASPDEATTQDTLFAYRSITKSFVGTVVLMLSDEGLIDLTAPVSSYVTPVPAAEHVTVAQLGQMRSGLANYSAVDGFGEWFVSNLDGEVDVRELLELAFASSPVFEADERYQYSNTNTLMLGEIIESVTSHSWFDEVQHRIIEPLGLRSVSYGLPNRVSAAAAQPPIATGFQLEQSAVVEAYSHVSPDWFGAAGALAGNIADLATWGRALGSGELITADTHRWQLESLGGIEDDPASPFYDRYGFAIGEIDGWVGHTGAGLGFQSLVMYDPASEVVIAVLLNGTGENQDLPVEVFDAVSDL